MQWELSDRCNSTAEAATASTWNESDVDVQDSDLFLTQLKRLNGFGVRKRWRCPLPLKSLPVTIQSCKSLPVTIQSCNTTVYTEGYDHAT